MRDGKVLMLVNLNPNMLVPWYLLACYAYYVQDSPLISDSTYDSIVEMFIDQWDDVEHYHKHLIDYDALKAGTYLGEYPSIVMDTVEMLQRESG